MTSKKNAYLKKWFIVADHDIEAARMIIELNPIILDVACFHCQQAIEKYLKTFLTFHDQNFLKTHDIVALKNQCAKIDKDFAGFKFKNLYRYSVRARYPDGYIMPSLKETKVYFKLVKEIQELVQNKVRL